MAPAQPGVAGSHGEKNMNAKEYIEQLAQSAGLSEEEKANVLKVATSNEKFAKGLEDSILMRSDYSRNMDALKADRAKWEKFYQDNLVWKAQEEQRLAELQAAQNGQPPVQQQVVQQVQPDLTAIEKKWEEKLAQRDGQMIGLLKVGMSLASQHAVEFKERLDVDALEKIAMDKKVSLQQAYDEYVAPRRAQQTEAQFKAKLEEARAEGARDFASKHKIPVDTQHREYHVMFDRDPKKQVGADDYVPNSGQLSPTSARVLRDNFVEEWNKTGAETSGT